MPAHPDYSGLAVDVLPLPAVVQLLAALVGLFGVAPLPVVEQACLVLLSVALIPAFGVLILPFVQQAPDSVVFPLQSH